jgi:hypothetical protein
VRDRHAHQLAAAIVAGERQIVAFDAQQDVPALRRIAPGRRALSSNTWNPLQMPSTSPPASACRRTAAITGDSAATAPARR